VKILTYYFTAGRKSTSSRREIACCQKNQEMSQSSIFGDRPYPFTTEKKEWRIFECISNGNGPEINQFL